MFLILFITWPLNYHQIQHYSLLRDSCIMHLISLTVDIMVLTQEVCYFLCQRKPSTVVLGLMNTLFPKMIQESSLIGRNVSKVNIPHRTQWMWFKMIIYINTICPRNLIVLIQTSQWAKNYIQIAYTNSTGALAVTHKCMTFGKHQGFWIFSANP